MRRAVLLLVNPWKMHVSGSEHKTVVDLVRQLVAKGVIQSDRRQIEMAELCTPLLEAVASSGATGQGALEKHMVDPSLSGIRDDKNRMLLLMRVKEFLRTYLEQYRRRVALPPLFASRETALDIQWPTQDSSVNVSTGLYIWGDVGIGKTMILDLFELCPTPSMNKRRAHIHSFMTMLGDRLFEVEQQQQQRNRPRGGADGAPTATSPSRRPMDIVVDEIVSETPILCFDEFQTFDVAHAALLAEFFTKAFQRGVFLMTTSNRPPQELFHLSSTFGSFLHILYKHCNIVHCTGIVDYRVAASKRGSLHRAVFVSPNTDEAAHQVIARVDRCMDGSRTSWEEGVQLPLYGRATVVPRRRGGVAVFGFSQLCGSAQQQLGPQDFQNLVKQFHTIVVLDVPQISLVTKNAAKLFIVLVDELYQHRAKLLFTSSVPYERLFDDADGHHSPADLEYAEGADERSPLERMQDVKSREEELSLARVLSRLMEMGSAEYILSDHTLFHIDDLDLPMLASA